ncbi:MAG: hypothetical protein Q8787_02515, partial [Sweet potato little leaf phytoplasma]|nr:hypothetical protein [Sweet potato little leaf phytoplasma]
KIVNNSKDTVGTITEIYHYLQLIYAHIGVYYDIQNNQPYQKYIASLVFIDEISKKYRARFGCVPENHVQAFLFGLKPCICMRNSINTM